MTGARRQLPTIDGIPDLGTVVGSPRQPTQPADDGGPILSDQATAVSEDEETGRPEGQPDRPRRSRRSTGRRAEARRRRRRQTVLRSTLAFLLVAGLSIGAVIGASKLVAGGDDDADAGESAAPISDSSDPQPTLVIATFDESNPDAGASLITVLAYDRETEDGTVLFIPAATVSEIPGHGLLPIGRAYGFGEGPLLDATLDNLLGVDLDNVVGISRQGWSSLFTRLGGLTLDVPERLDERQDDGSSRARFLPGEQFLDGPRVAELLTFREASETELEVLPRAQRVILAMLDLVAEDPSVLDAVFTDGAPMLDTPAEPEQVRELLRLLAEAETVGELEVRTLPVSPLGSGEQDSYRVDEERADPLIASRLASSVPSSRSQAGRDLQILNGNGAPGIGQRVAEKLVPAGFRVVLTRNADRFDHAETRIIVFDDSPEQLAIAEEIQRLLGVGSIERSRLPQSVADVTVVIGLDFLERR